MSCSRNSVFHQSFKAELSINVPAAVTVSNNFRVCELCLIIAVNSDYFCKQNNRIDEVSRFLFFLL